MLSGLSVFFKTRILPFLEDWAVYQNELKFQMSKRRKTAKGRKIKKLYLYHQSNFPGSYTYKVCAVRSKIPVFSSTFMLRNFWVLYASPLKSLVKILSPDSLLFGGDYTWLPRRACHCRLWSFHRWLLKLTHQLMTKFISYWPKWTPVNLQLWKL